MIIIEVKPNGKSYSTVTAIAFNFTFFIPELLSTHESRMVTWQYNQVQPVANFD